MAAEDIHDTIFMADANPAASHLILDTIPEEPKAERLSTAQPPLVDVETAPGQSSQFPPPAVSMHKARNNLFTQTTAQGAHEIEPASNSAPLRSQHERNGPERCPQLPQALVSLNNILEPLLIPTTTQSAHETVDTAFDDIYADMDADPSADDTVSSSMVVDAMEGTQIPLTGTGSLPGRDQDVFADASLSEQAELLIREAEQLARQAEWEPSTDWTAWQDPRSPQLSDDNSHISSTPSLASVSTHSADGHPQSPAKSTNDRVYHNDKLWNTINSTTDRTFHQQRFAAEMSRTLSRLLAHFLPLTHIRFGSRTSPRRINRLREVIPKQIFNRFFREYHSYAALADSLASVREDQ
jgi:hypothetical protein